MSTSSIGGVVGGVIGFIATSGSPAGFQWGCVAGKLQISSEFPIEEGEHPSGRGVEVAAVAPGGDRP